jgi:hypothetical protein
MGSDGAGLLVAFLVSSTSAAERSVMEEQRPHGGRRDVAGGPLDGKPFGVTGYEVWCAWLKVRENKGPPGVDAVSIAAFEERLEGNLYKVWNRMASGSYMPPPVRAVEIPKAGGGTRMLGVPTIADRVAQTVVASRVEQVTEKFFHHDSYGYRPRRGAHDAHAAARRRCWEYDWVLQFDIRKFFDSVPWDRIIKAVEALRLPPWVLLYVKRWLAAPVRMRTARSGRGTGEPPKDLRYHPCWRTYSCITPWTPGWNASSGPWSSSVMRTTPWCTA